VKLHLHALFTNAVDGGVWSVSRPSCSILVPLNRGLCGPQSSFGHYGEEKIFTPARTWTTIPHANSWSLCWLHCPNCKSIMYL